MIITLLFCIVIGSTLLSLIPACVSDFQTRRIPIGYWKPAAYIAIPASFVLFGVRLVSGDITIGCIAPMVISAFIVLIVAMFCGYFDVFGGADSIAISVIALTSFHFGKTVYVTDTPYFMTAFLLHFIVISLMLYGIVILRNIITHAIAELPPDRRYLGCIATKIPFKYFKWYHGIVMETIDENNRRSFLPINRATFASDRNLTTTLYSHGDEPWVAPYRSVDGVWVSCIVPFVIPITLAYCTTLVAVVLL
jgi:hypothetical protein